MPSENLWGGGGDYSLLGKETDRLTNVKQRAPRCFGELVFFCYATIIVRLLSKKYIRVDNTLRTLYATHYVTFHRILMKTDTLHTLLHILIKVESQLAQLHCGNVVRTFAERGDNVGIISCSNVFL